VKRACFQPETTRLQIIKKYSEILKNKNQLFQATFSKYLKIQI